MRPSVVQVLGPGKQALAGEMMEAYYKGVREDWIIEAAKLRYTARVLAAMRSRPVPNAPVLFWGKTPENDRIVPMKELKGYLYSQWDQAAADNQRLLVSGNLGRITQSQPVAGVCANCGVIVYAVWPYHSTPPCRIVRRLPLPQSPEAWRMILSEWRTCPDPRVLAAHGVVCDQCRIICAVCGDPASLEDQAPDYIYSKTAMCHVCIDNDWLSIKSPPALVRHRLRQWLAATDQFVTTL